MLCVVPQIISWDINIFASNDYRFSRAIDSALNLYKGSWMSSSKKCDSDYLVAAISDHWRAASIKKINWEVGREHLRTPWMSMGLVLNLC